jgi:hypothetical protein
MAWCYRELARGKLDNFIPMQIVTHFNTSVYFPHVQNSRRKIEISPEQVPSKLSQIPEGLWSKYGDVGSDIGFKVATGNNTYKGLRLIGNDYSLYYLFSVQEKKNIVTSK